MREMTNAEMVEDFAVVVQFWDAEDDPAHREIMDRLRLGRCPPSEIAEFGKLVAPLIRQLIKIDEQIESLGGRRKRSSAVSRAALEASGRLSNA